MLKFFSATHSGSMLDEDGQRLVALGIGLGRASMNSDYQDNFLVKKFSTPYQNTPEANKMFLTKLYTYCAKKTNGLINAESDWNRPEVMRYAMSNETFSFAFFAILIESLNGLNAVNEVADIMTLANVSDVPLGGSKTFEVESKALYKVQEGAYGHLHSVYQEQIRTPITVLPAPKKASVDFDVVQMTPLGYDFGKQIAKLAMSFRVKLYTEVVNLIFTVSNVSSTVFYEANFARSTYAELAQRLQAVNGGAPVYAHGTNLAFQNMSDNITSGFNVLDEKVKTGYIGNLYNVPSVLISQAVDSNTANATFRVPNDRVLLLSNIGDKPIKVVKEAYTYAIPKEGKDDTTYRRVYTFIDSWGMEYCTQASYGIQMT